jgi:hypothetical protein
MATSITFAFGIYVAVGMGWDTEGVPCPGCGLGMSTKAQLDEVGVASPAPRDVQLENSREHKIRTK